MGASRAGSHEIAYWMVRLLTRVQPGNRPGCTATSSLSPTRAQYDSPDKGLVALVVTVGKSSESRVEVRSETGRLLAARDYSSRDGEHGFGVVKAVWTPDSKFFVYSLANSGGHQPWHFPVEFYARVQNEILSLDDALRDAVMSPQFSIAAPDRVTAEFWFSRQTKTVALAGLPPTQRTPKRQQPTGHLDR